MMTRVIVTVVIGAGVVLRAWGLSGVPFETHHDLRQYDTAAVARNFATGSMNVLFPAADWGGRPGYVESEFPAYTWTVALLYRAFGVHEQLGGGLNTLIYVLSAALLFQFIRALLGEPAATFAVFFYTVAPLGIFYTRDFQPDALMALASLAALYYFWRWANGDSLLPLGLSLLCLSLTIAIKPGNLYLGLPLLLIAIRWRGLSALRMPALWIYAVTAMLLPALWYLHAFGLWHAYGNSYFRHLVGQPIPALADPIWWGLGGRLVDEVVRLITTPAGAILLLVGIRQASCRSGALLLWWALGFIAPVVALSGQFLGHDYYLLPFVFIAAAWMGSGAAWLWSRGTAARAVVAGICLITVALSARELRTLLQKSEDSLGLTEFSRLVEARTKPDDLVTFVADVCTISPEDPPYEFMHRTAQGDLVGSFPQYFYLSHRKGWCIGLDHDSPAFLNKLREAGSSYAAVMHVPGEPTTSPRLTAWLDCSQTRTDLVPGIGALYRLDTHVTPANCRD